MTEQLDTRSGLRFGWPRGTGAWGVDVNANFQILAYRGTHINIKHSRIETPPSNPTEADCYSVGPNPTGAWALFAENTLAVWGHSAVGGTLAWLNITPLVGWIAYDETLGSIVAFDGTSWSASTTSGSLPVTQRTFAEIATGLNALTGSDQVDYDALKNKPTTITSAQALKITQAITVVYTDSTTTSGDGTTTSPIAVVNPFTALNKTKLDGIEDNATADQTPAEIRDALQTLTGTLRLDAAYIQGLPAGTTSSETGATIKAKLESLIGSNPDVRLIYGAIKGGPPATAEQNVQPDWNATSGDAAILNKPTIPIVPAELTGTQIKTKLEALSVGPPDERLDASAIKNLPTSGGGTAETGLTIKSKLEGLTSPNKLEYTAIQNGPSVDALTQVATQLPVEGDGKAATPIKLDTDTNTKLGKLTTSQPAFSSVVNYQADWNETNTNSFNFIRNKPTITTGGGGGGITSLRLGNTLIGDGVTSNLNVANPYTAVEKTKLAGIETGATADQSAVEIRDLLQTLTLNSRLDASAIRNLPTGTGEQNVQADWGVTDTSSDAYIRRKPAIPSDLSVKLSKLDTLNISLQMPTGGTVGQYIRRTASGYEWATLPTISSTGGHFYGQLPEVAKELFVDLGASGTNFITFDTTAKAVTNGKALVDGAYSVIEVGNYDPIFIVDERIIAVDGGNENVGATLNDDTSIRFTLFKDGMPTEYTLRVGYDSNNKILLSKIAGGSLGQSVSVRDVTHKEGEQTLTTEQVQDIVGGMVSGNVENDIQVTYNDAAGKLNFNVTITGGTGGLSTVAINDTLKGNGQMATPLGSADGVMARINLAYDLFRLVDNAFMFTAGAGDGRVGWVDGVTGLPSLGIYSGANPEFTVGTTTWQVGAVFLDGNNLEIRLYTKPATPATIPDLPRTIDFKIGSRTFRSHDADYDNVTSAEAGAGHAYIQLLWGGAASLFSNGKTVTGQVLLEGVDSTRLLPIGGTNGQVLKIVSNLPSWVADTDGGSGDDIVKQYTSNTQAIISSTTLSYILDTVTLSTAQKQLRDTNEWKISHYLKVNIKVATSGNFRLAIWPTGSTTALTTTTYEALPTTATDKELKLDVPSTAINGYRAVLEFDQVIGNVTIENVTSTSMVVGVSSGAAYTNEQARDAVGNALVAGESQSDIDTTRRDIGNTIELHVKPNVIDYANMARDATDTTLLKEQGSWQTGIGLKNAIKYEQTTDRSLVIPNTGAVTLHRVDISDEMKNFAETTDWVIDHYLKLTIRKTGAGKAPVKVRLSTISGTLIHETTAALPDVTSTNSTHNINLTAGNNTSYNVQLIDSNGANVTVQYMSISNIFTAGAGIRDKLVALPSTGGVTANGDDRLPWSAIGQKPPIDSPLPIIDFVGLTGIDGFFGFDIPVWPETLDLAESTYEIRGENIASLGIPTSFVTSDRFVTTVFQIRASTDLLTSLSKASGSATGYRYKISDDNVDIYTSPTRSFARAGSRRADPTAGLAITRTGNGSRLKLKIGGIGGTATCRVSQFLPRTSAGNDDRGVYGTMVFYFHQT